MDKWIRLQDGLVATAEQLASLDGDWVMYSGPAAAGEYDRISGLDAFYDSGLEWGNNATVSPAA